MEVDEVARFPVVGEAPGWTPVWAMPNVTLLGETVETSNAALVTIIDARLGTIANRNPTLKTFLRAFRDEFGERVIPTIGMIREDAPESVRTVDAFGGFRDAVCVSAILVGQSVSLTSKRSKPVGILYSDAFDVYPWFPSAHFDKHVGAVTPMLHGFHEVSKLQPQFAPALGHRSLSTNHIDRPLLQALLARWENYFAAGNETVDNRRLFRSLEMARTASKSPGGTDANG
jgi:hypothetical protein